MLMDKYNTIVFPPLSCFCNILFECIQPWLWDEFVFLCYDERLFAFTQELKSPEVKKKIQHVTWP